MEKYMVKCKICLEEKGASDEYHHLHFHLYKKHHMTVRHYRSLFPDAVVVSNQFIEKQRKLMMERRKQIPDFQERLNRWRHKNSESGYDEYVPTIDDIDRLHDREEYLKFLLGSGVKGEKYKRAYREYMEIRQILKMLYEKKSQQSNTY
jgi:hypothetical protein